MSDSPSLMQALVRVVDDDESVRNSTVFNLRIAGIPATGYDSAESFLALDELTKPGCLILDVRMPGMSGLELQDEMIRRGIDLPVIFLTGHGDVPMAVMTLHKGAADFFEKPADPALLRDKAKTFCEMNLALRHKKQELAAMREAFDSLTLREKEVLRRVADDQLNKVIAIDLGIQEHTVKIHRANACRKLNVRSPIEIHRYLERLGELLTEPAHS